MEASFSFFFNLFVIADLQANIAVDHSIALANDRIVPSWDKNAYLSYEFRNR